MFFKKKQESDLEVNCDWLAEHRDEVTVIDVREPHEWQEQRMAETELIPLGQLAGQLPTREDRDAVIVVHCRSGKRSMKAVKMMREQGFSKCYNLEGGILAWANAGHPVLSGDGR